jgi:hypothetical protein
MYLVAQASRLCRKIRVRTAHHPYSLRKQTTGSCANKCRKMEKSGKFKA